MPSDKYKAAAVPYINQKGERSMKKVKVEIYVAGKKPSYAPEHDDEEETSEEEEEDEEELDEEDNEEDEVEEEREDKRQLSERPDESNPNLERLGENPIEHPIDDDDDDDDDDPRSRKLKQLSKSKINPDQLIKAQTASQKAHIFNENNSVIEEENEEEVKLRHLTARQLQVGEPLGIKAVLSEVKKDVRHAYTDDDDEDRFYGDDDEKELDTEDILNNYTVKIISNKDFEKHNRAEEEELVKKLIRNSKREAELKAETMRRIEEETKREIENEMAEKDDLEPYELEAVITDDEDDELAYEEWKLREIKRVQRDRLERATKVK